MTEVRTLLSGLAFGESARWHDGRFWFSDWGDGTVNAVDLEGASEVVARLPSMPFCFDWSVDGSLLILSGGEAKLVRRDAGGTLSTVAELAHLSRHAWNEVVVDGRGNAYLNNIGFDFPHGEVTTGIVAVVNPDGAARRVADGIEFGNGMAVTPDDSTLIVAESCGGRLTAFDIEADGSLSNRRVWADLGGAPPDGICLDAENAVWYADVPNRRCVRVAEGGTVLNTVDVDRGCFSCALGGPDGRTLFIVAAQWPMSTGGTERTGQVLMTAAPAPPARWR